MPLYPIKSLFKSKRITIIATTNQIFKIIPKIFIKLLKHICTQLKDANINYT